VALDGKTVRRSGEVRLLSAVTHGRPVVLAQVAEPDDTTEVTQVEALLDPLELAGVVDDVLYAWIRRRAGTGGSTGVALDGKTVRRSGEVRLLSAVTHGRPVVLAQVAVPDDTTEVTQVEALLDPLELAGVTVSADAAHTSTATAAYLTGRGAHYLLPVKGNRPTLHAQATSALHDICTRPADHTVEERGHGRITRRSLWVTTATGVDLPGVTQVLRVRRDIHDLDGTRRSKQIVDYVTSHDPTSATPALLADAARHHWGIEAVHWIRDVTWGEDHQHAYTGTGVRTLATLRNLALSVLRLHGVTQIRRTLQRLHRHPDQAFSLLNPIVT
jgi:predicted transposase YbfD/YdcC